MFARGEFEVGAGVALTLPQSAVLLRDGFSYVLRVGADSRVAQTKVAVGRRSGDRIEITSGLDAKARVVASGGGFLSDGDTVRVVELAGQVSGAAR
jgi:multidrug efflux pump subunit AcrA (membrane-fusion protein)